MSEYSGAPGRGQRNSVGKRAMQVDRQPSPWPCVAMLAGLLLFCLMAPRYWRDSDPQEDATIGLASDSPHGSSEASRSVASTTNVSEQRNFSGWNINFENMELGRLARAGNNDLLNLLGTPTIEELIAARTVATQLTGPHRRRGVLIGPFWSVGRKCRGLSGLIQRSLIGWSLLGGGWRNTTRLVRCWEWLADCRSGAAVVGRLWGGISEVGGGVPGRRGDLAGEGWGAVYGEGVGAGGSVGDGAGASGVGSDSFLVRAASFV